MRGRKPSIDRSIDKTVIQGKGKANQTGKGSAFAKRRPTKSNKENIVQITEPLDPTPQAQPSKEFLHSRDSLPRTSRGTLQDIRVSSNLGAGDAGMMATGPLRKGYGT